MSLKPEVQFTTIEDLWEEDSRSDEASGSARCHCGRFAHLESAPTVDVFGNHIWQVRCNVHGLVWVGGSA